MAVLQAPIEPLSEHSRDEDIEDNRGTCLLAQASSFIARLFIRSGDYQLAFLHVYLSIFFSPSMTRF